MALLVILTMHADLMHASRVHAALEKSGQSAQVVCATEPGAVAAVESASLVLAILTKTSSADSAFLDIVAAVLPKLVLVLFELCRTPPFLENMQIVDASIWSGNLTALVWQQILHGVQLTLDPSVTTFAPDAVDIFISYRRTDQVLAVMLAQRIRLLGFTVWFDESLTAGQNFNSEINARLEKAKLVLVLWTPASIKSDWVRAEAQFALREGKLLGLTQSGTRVPAPFNISDMPFRTDGAGYWLELLAELGKRFGRVELLEPKKLTASRADYEAHRQLIQLRSYIDAWSKRYGEDPTEWLFADAIVSLTAAAARHRRRVRRAAFGVLSVAALTVVFVLVSVVQKDVERRAAEKPYRDLIQNIQDLQELDVTTGSDLGVNPTPGTVFQDCDGCPPMVVMPGRNIAIARFPLSRSQARTLGLLSEEPPSRYYFFRNEQGQVECRLTERSAEGEFQLGKPCSDIDYNANYRSRRDVFESRNHAAAFLKFIDMDRGPLPANIRDAKKAIKAISDRSGRNYRLPTIDELKSYFLPFNPCRDPAYLIDEAAAKQSLSPEKRNNADEMLSDLVYKNIYGLHVDSGNLATAFNPFSPQPVPSDGWRLGSGLIKLWSPSPYFFAPIYYEVGQIKAKKKDFYAPGALMQRGEYEHGARCGATFAYESDIVQPVLDLKPIVRSPMRVTPLPEGVWVGGVKDLRNKTETQISLEFYYNIFGDIYGIFQAHWSVQKVDPVCRVEFKSLQAERQTKQGSLIWPEWIMSSKDASPLVRLRDFHEHDRFCGRNIVFDAVPPNGDGAWRMSYTRRDASGAVAATGELVHQPGKGLWEEVQ
jgi:hypothetical protein